MLQVGRLGCSSHTSGCPLTPALEAWTRAHFAAFSIVSSPLVISVNPTDANIEPILDIIGNKGAMAVNQAWAGHPGSLVRTLPPAPAAGPSGTKCVKGLMPGGDIHVANLTVAEGIAWCRSQAHCAGFTAPATPFATATCDAASTAVLELHFKDPWGSRQPNGKDTSSSWQVGGTRPVAGVQIWSKPLGGGKTAALFINGGLSNYTAKLSLAELNVTAATATVTDVWTGEDAGKVVGGEWATGSVAPLDSRFVIFTA